MKTSIHTRHEFTIINNTGNFVFAAAGELLSFILRFESYDNETTLLTDEQEKNARIRLVSGSQVIFFDETLADNRARTKGERGVYVFTLASPMELQTMTGTRILFNGLPSFVKKADIFTETLAKWII